MFRTQKRTHIAKSAAKHAPKRHIEPPDFWAFLTLLAFPLAGFVATGYGFSAISSFFLGLGASLTIMIANSLADDRVWMFSPKWQARFSHPEFSFRLALVTGALLFALETYLLVMFFTDGGMDQQLVSLVFTRQCQNPTPVFQDFCQALQNHVDFGF
jgi:hypothetical protein